MQNCGKKIDDIIARVSEGNRLGTDEYLAFYTQADFHAICSLADDIRRRMHGKTVYYIRNAHINYTNICTCRCPVCTFGKNACDENAYSLSIEEVREIAKKAAARDVREFHVVGGLNPELPYRYYVELVSTLASAGAGAAVKAFTAVEIDFIAAGAGKGIEAVLAELKAAGLGCLPGGGAEIFAPGYREKAFPKKIPARRWLEIHRIAHGLGLWTTATMLYGHTETEAQRIEHLMELRNAQERSMREFGVGFMCFVPLGYRPPNNAGVQTVLDMRTIAISRIILGNVGHIKAFGPVLGEAAAQVGLFCGADDIDGLPEDYAIVEDRRTRESVDILLKNALQAGLDPVERDSFYNRVRH